jgi:hypothetical protein
MRGTVLSLLQESTAATPAVVEGIEALTPAAVQDYCRNDQDRDDENPEAAAHVSPLCVRRISSSTGSTTSGRQRLPTSDGRTVRWGTLYQSDSLSKLEGADLVRFQRLGIRTAIDLRYPPTARVSRSEGPQARRRRDAGRPAPPACRDRVATIAQINQSRTR